MNNYGFHKINYIIPYIFETMRKNLLKINKNMIPIRNSESDYGFYKTETSFTIFGTVMIM